MEKVKFFSLGRYKSINIIIDFLNLDEDSDEVRESRFEIIQMFNDNEESIFSIHNISKLAQNFNVKIGSWHGPNMLASIFRFKLYLYKYNNQNIYSCYLSQIFEENKYDDGKLKLYISNDGMIYKDQLFNSPTAESFVILICMRLGSNSLNKIYIQSLQYLCKCKYFSGIIGGRPSSSYFFMGCEGTLKLNL